MSENQTSPKFFKMEKAVPGNVIFTLHPVDNPMLSKIINLTNRNPSVMLPKNWALGVFVNDGTYSLYSNGVITFSDNEDLVRTAYEESIYFSDTLDFTPAKTVDNNEITAVLRSGNRKSIDNMITKYGKERVREIAFSVAKELPVGIVNMLESIFKVQLIIDGADDILED